MPDEARLHQATIEEITDTLSFALRYEGRKRVHHADDMMARITAERLVEHLQRSGYVLMKRPTGPAPTTSRHAHPHDPNPVNPKPVNPKPAKP